VDQEADRQAQLAETAYDNARLIQLPGGRIRFAVRQALNDD
jgi:hypothetical protein